MMIPSGAVTFLFTDIRESSRKWEIDAGRMRVAIKRHNAELTRIFEARGGFVFKCSGDGLCVAFDNPADAVLAALEAQRFVQGEPWDVPDGLEVKMAVHTGLAEPDANDYFGPVVNRVSRLVDMAAGGQVLVSRATWDMVQESDLGEATLQKLGVVPLEGMHRPEELYSLHHPALKNGHPPLKAKKAQDRRHNLSPDDRPFIGRGRELEELRERLLQKSQRLITVTGIGGLGKSRLAKEAARRLAREFKDGAWLVECEGLQNREHLVAATLSTLGAPFDPGSPEESLHEFLEDRELLLVFDCFEHLLESRALLGEILQRAPGVCCLVTSRTILSLRWEYELSLGPMARERDGGSSDDAVALFLDSAAHVAPITLEEPGARRILAKLVDELEGVPLAIVLAASRLRHLSIKDLLAQVRMRRLEVLESQGAETGRHRTLFSVIEGSFALLDPADQLLAAKLAVFEHGFYREDAEAVLPEHHDLVSRLARLRDHSLVSCTVVQGRMRYRILDTIREYLRGVESGPTVDQAWLRHAQHFAARAKQIRRLYETGNWQQAAAQFWLDAGNFRAAIRTSIERLDMELVRDFGRSLARVLLEAGAVAEFKSLMQAAEDAARQAKDLPLLAELYGLQGAYHRRQGNEESAVRQWSLRVDLCIETGDLIGEADSLLDIADVHFAAGRLEEAGRWLQRFWEMEHKLPRHTIRAAGHLLAARVALAQGQKEEALRLATSAEEMVRDLRSDDTVFYVWRGLAAIYAGVGAPERGLQLLRGLLHDALTGHFVHYAGIALFEMSAIYEQMGEVDQAAKALAIALHIPRSASPALRREARKRKQRFEESGGKELLDLRIKDVGRRSWISLAHDFAGASPMPLESLKVATFDGAVPLADLVGDAAAGD